MTTRAADASIKGYYYQFDTSILELLNLKRNNDSITIEGIEDIDIHSANETTSVQCKYLSKPRFINSAVRQPIILMLNHFVHPSTPNDFKYVLYSHFENEVAGNEPEIDLTRLKSILSYKENKVAREHHTENGITDAQLTSFLGQFTFAFGKEFYEQQNTVIHKLKKHFNCTDFEADTLYYNNALRIVIDRAIKKKASDRVITKAEFINQIDSSEKLFNEWFIKLRSKKEYLKNGAQALKAFRALDPLRTKFVIIGRNILEANNSELPIHSLIENLIGKYYKVNSALRNAKPWTLVLDCDTKALNEVKRKLIQQAIDYNDGHEYLGFSSKFFNRKPVINTSKNGSKISKSSYLVKLISASSMHSNISELELPSVLINFSANPIPKEFRDGQCYDFKYCEDLKDVYKLLAP